MNRGTLFNRICPMNKRQGTMHKAHLNNVWLFSTGQKRGEKNFVVVQANIYLGKNRWAQNLSSNKWKSDVTKCKCTKCCSVPKYFVGWHLFSIQFLPFVPMDHFPALVSPGHCPLGRQWKSSELLHSTPSASLTLTQLWLYFNTIISIFITGSLAVGFFFKNGNFGNLLLWWYE